MRGAHGKTRFIAPYIASGIQSGEKIDSRIYGVLPAPWATHTYVALIFYSCFTKYSRYPWSGSFFVVGSHFLSKSRLFRYPLYFEEVTFLVDCYMDIDFLAIWAKKS